MALKKLSKFQYFDFEEFSVGKKYMCIGQKEWKDFNSNNVLGTKVEVVIAQDKTDYGAKEGEYISNLYEKVIIKIPSKLVIPMNSEVRIINAEVAVYGEFRNQLSIIAENIEVVSK